LICPGVTIGQCGVAAAGSVVARSIPAFEVHSGNPAHFVKRRIFRETTRETTLCSPDRAPEYSDSCPSNG
jgi:acetyltransferase-like isoleucine patch superfamily enzyme